MKRRYVLLATVPTSILALAAIANDAGPGDPGHAAAKAAIEANWAAYEASLKADDLDAWLSLWTDDGVQMPPGEPAVVGMTDLRRRNGRILETTEIAEFDVSNEEVELAGDWAWSRGTYTATVLAKDGGVNTDLSGKYMSIFKRNADGEWKLHRDIFNFSAPPATK